MFSFFYTLSLHLLALFLVPKLLYQRIRYGKYKESFSRRLGLYFPPVDQPVIWIHAVSVGETKAAAPLVKRIKASYPHMHILFSNITETGHAEALRTIPEADAHVYLPFDLPYVIRPIVQRVKPKLLILVESDFWFHFQDEVKKQGGSIVVVNAKISKRSLKRFRILPWLTSPLFNTLDRILAQSESYKNRFLQLGVLRDKVHVLGNIKLDGTYPELSVEEIAAWKEKLGIRPTDIVLVIGSTHDPEEKELLSELKKVWKKEPELKVLIAPRHPERFKRVEGLFVRYEIPFALWSKKEKLDGKNVLLIDTLGQLRACYQLANIAIVAGSFTDKVGGHNLLEPSWYEKPVLFGPYTFQQQDLAELIKQKNAGLQVGKHDVAKTILELLQNPAKRQEMGRHGKEIFLESRGATERSFHQLKEFLE